MNTEGAWLEFNFDCAWLVHPLGYNLRLIELAKQFWVINKIL